MKRLLLPLWLLVGCGSGDPPVITSVTVNPTSVAAGGETTLSVEVANFELREPTIGDTHALRAADTGDDGDYPDGGHFHVYLDSVETNPLPLNCPEYCEHPGWQNSVRVQIPDDASAGAHELILRLNRDNHMFLKPEIRKSASLTITAP